MRSASAPRKASTSAISSMCISPTTEVTLKADNGTARQAVPCGESAAYVLAGGARMLRGRSASVEIGESFPDTPSSWTTAVTIRGDEKAGDVTVKLYAVCIKK